MIDEELELRKKAYTAATENQQEQARLFRDAALNAQRQANTQQLITLFSLSLLGMTILSWLGSSAMLKGEVHQTNNLVCAGYKESAPLTYTYLCQE